VLSEEQTSKDKMMLEKSKRPMEMIPETAKTPSKRQKKNILQQNMNHSIQSYSSIPHSLRQILEGQEGFTNLSASIDGAGFILVSMNLESKNRIFLWEPLSDFFSEYDLPKDIRFTSDMVQLIPSFSSSGFGLVACTSVGKIYYWKDIAKQSAIASVVAIEDTEICTRLSKLDHETFAITTHNATEKKANLHFVSIKNQSIAHRALTETQKLGSFFLGWLFCKPVEPLSRIVNLFSQLMHDDKIRIYVLCERSQSFYLQSWIVAFNASDTLEAEFPLSEAILVYAKPNQNARVHLLDFHYSGTNEMYMLYYIPQFGEYAIALFDVASRVISNVIPIVSGLRVHNDLLTNIGFHVNVQDSQVDIYVWLNNTLYITSFDRFSSLMQSTIDRYSDDKGFIGGGPSSHGDLLVLSLSSLEVLECKTLYRKPLLGLLEKKKESEEKMINSITDADLVNVDFQIKMLSTLFKDYCLNQAQLSGFSQKTVLLLHNKNLAEACNRLCLTVLNGYNLGEEDWSQMDFQHVTPSLGAEKLLIEKKKKFAIMVACLSSTNMFYSLPFDFRFQLSQYAEMLVCSLRLVEFCSESEFIYVTKPSLTAAMETTLKKNQVEIAGHSNVAQLFFSQVTLVFSFLVELFGEYKKKMMTQPQIQLDDFHSSLTYSFNELFIRIFSSVLDHREKNKAIYLINEQEFIKSKDLAHNWSNISSLVHILKELCQITWSHLSVTEEEHDMSDEMDVIDETPTRQNQLFAQLAHIYAIIFTQLKELCNKEYPNLYQEYCEYKKESFGKLVAAKQYAYAVSLAELNEEFETLIFICEETHYFSEGQLQLAKYAATYVDSGFPEALFNWYLRQGKIKKLVDNLPSLDKQREVFLKQHDPKLLWLLQLRIGKFSECAKETATLAQKSGDYLEKKYLLAVDCLCEQMDFLGKNKIDNLDKLVESDKTLVEDKDSFQYRHRRIIEYQDRVARQTMRPDFKHQILSAKELIDETISIANPPHLLDMHSALKIYELTTKDRSYEENLNLLRYICTRILLLDDWEAFAIKEKVLEEREIAEIWSETYLVQILRSGADFMHIITPKLILSLRNEIEYTQEAWDCVKSAYAMVFSETTLPELK
jgi:hypothetical protein